MTNDFLAKIIRFVKEDKGRFIIVNPDESEAVIVMPFSEYEAMRKPPLTASLESDKIKRDIADLQNKPEVLPPPPSPPKQGDDWGGNESLETDDHYYMEPLE